MINTIKTFVLLAGLTALFMGVGQWIGGSNGAIIALVIAAVMNAASYWFSDKIVLSMYRAQEVDFSTAPGLVSLVQRLANQAGLPMPRVYVIPSDAPNAFATGRSPDHSAVAVTEGILQRLNEAELAGVIGHELAHIKNRDILISSIVATFAGAISYLATMAQWAAIFGFGRSDEDDGNNVFSLLFMAILAPVIATLIQLAISRSREFLADRIGAEISGQPIGLANALMKLENTHGRVSVRGTEATAHLFIVSPLSGRGLTGLFRTHPHTEDRVERLRGYAVESGLLAY
jgi:heat shock protein HtpX